MSKMRSGGKRPAVAGFAPKKGVMKRAIKLLYKFYPKMFVITLVCILFNAVVSSLPSIFMERVFTSVNNAIREGVGWEKYGWEITEQMLILIGLYAASLISGAINKQLLAIMTQGYLKKMRGMMFNGMQDLPIKYFDTICRSESMSLV